MVKKCAMILEFSKDKSQSFQHHQVNNPMANQIKSHHKRSRWLNRKKVVHLHHIPLNNEERTKCWRCDGASKKKDCPNPLQFIISNPNFNQPCSYYKIYGRMWTIISPYIWNYNKVNHKLPMLKKIMVFEKARKVNVQPIKG